MRSGGYLNTCISATFERPQFSREKIKRRERGPRCKLRR